ncbi:SDR family NAD(P)-dependent oxidoreductase [Tenacibaculum caenipelagi]|uniref:NAD(P)-dependent dehydrogenase (Short-subunit alcohol dehydrogenase family) n=1 Tax=Tenacibaculum caenipelagi TaxID=1325435 RepID=A0A4R6TFB4_9FLAO|nr:SDR family oxidoreductase [Tenacibaculum caenipelagi]TDQ25752.1 NAD(P)-dependent dehydrogenase (short-subunit alcohol dehydrogenase family) [Tenacibaculum caenipelagi]
MSKTVIITGGTAGIGKATALKFAENGYNIVTTSRSNEKAKKFLDEFKQAGYEATVYNVDVTKEEQVEKLISDTVEKYGSVDVLVNNSAIAGEPKIFAQTSKNNMRNMVETNVMGLYYGMRYGILQMLKQEKKGNIVNLASIAGLNGVEYAGEYGATKHAVVGMTKGAAVEYATSGIRINAVAPGAILTDILNDVIASGQLTKEGLGNIHPMKRPGTVEDIANGIFFLASDECPFMTGTILNIDGGYNAK